MLKEEADDLSNLAPTPGDACIPLDESTSFLSSYDEINDLIDSYIMREDINGFEPTAILSRSSQNYFADTKDVRKRPETTDDHMQTAPHDTLKDAIINDNGFVAVSNNSCIGIDLMDADSVVVECNKTGLDPFISYRDESSNVITAKSDLDCSTQVKFS